MNLLKRLFGQWDVVLTAKCTGIFGSAILGKSWGEDVVVIIERHSKSGEERAFIHRLDGQKSKISPYLARGVAGGKT